MVETQVLDLLSAASYGVYQQEPGWKAELDLDPGTPKWAEGIPIGILTMLPQHQPWTGDLRGDNRSAHVQNQNHKKTQREGSALQASKNPQEKPVLLVA